MQNNMQNMQNNMQNMQNNMQNNMQKMHIPFFGIQNMQNNMQNMQNNMQNMQNNMQNNMMQKMHMKMVTGPSHSRSLPVGQLLKRRPGPLPHDRRHVVN